MTAFMTISKVNTIVVLGQERRRHWSVEVKLAMVRESPEPGQSVMALAQWNDFNPSQLFHWHNICQDGRLPAVSAGEAERPASELTDHHKHINELQRKLGKETMKTEMLKELVEVASSR